MKTGTSEFPNLSDMSTHDLVLLLLSAYIGSALLDHDKAFVAAIQAELATRKS